jgi:hypothetical protein
MLLLASVRGQLATQCKSGIGTEFDGFQGLSSSVWFVNFPSYSSLGIKAPFVADMSDFYFSVWVRYDEGLATASGTKSNIFKCGAPMRKTSLLELSLSK